MNTPEFKTVKHSLVTVILDPLGSAGGPGVCWGPWGLLGARGTEEGPLDPLGSAGARGTEEGPLDPLGFAGPSGVCWGPGGQATAPDDTILFNVGLFMRTTVDSQFNVYYV